MAEPEVLAWGGPPKWNRNYKEIRDVPELWFAVDVIRLGLGVACWRRCHHGLRPTVSKELWPDGMACYECDTTGVTCVLPSRWRPVWVVLEWRHVGVLVMYLKKKQKIRRKNKQMPYCYGNSMPRLKII